MATPLSKYDASRAQIMALRSSRKAKPKARAVPSTVTVGRMAEELSRALAEAQAEPEPNDPPLMELMS